MERFSPHVFENGEVGVRRDENGIFVHRSEAEHLAAKLAAAEARCSELTATLVSRHGGEPLALLTELDASKEATIDVLRELSEYKLRAQRLHCGWVEGDGPCKLGRDILCDYCELHITMLHKRDRANEAEAKCAELGREVARLRAANEDWHMRVTQLNNDAGSYIDTIDTERAARAGAEAKCAELGDRLRHAEAEIDRLWEVVEFCIDYPERLLRSSGTFNGVGASASLDDQIDAVLRAMGEAKG